MSAPVSSTNLFSLPSSANWRAWLFAPVNNLPLLIFRMGFGLLLALHCLVFILSGELHTYFVEPVFVFTAPGFEWLSGFRGVWVYGYFWAMVVLGVLIAVGLWYRFAIICFTILWQLLYLVQEVNYNNHYYLLLLLCYLLCIMPAAQDLSIDAHLYPDRRTDECPRWILLLLVIQVVIVYTCAGLAKFNSEWLEGHFYRTQAAFRRPVLGLIAPNTILGFRHLVTYGGIAIDLLLCPMLLSKRFRKIALVIGVLYHLANALLFSIGIFPYLNILLFVFFIPADTLSRYFPHRLNAAHQFKQTGIRQQKLLISLLSAYLLLQVFLPLRAKLFQGNVYWTEKGYTLSWRMMMRTKGGNINFTTRDPATGKSEAWKMNDLTTTQQKALAIKPYLILQYAKRIKIAMNEKGIANVEVYAHSLVQMNDHPKQSMVNSETDLAKANYSFFFTDPWIADLH